jgi:tetratricopeptide (TPR) repeat protein
MGVLLADLYVAGGQGAEAEAVLRGVLRVKPRSVDGAIRLSELLVEAGRAEEALTVTAALAGGTAPDHGVLAQHAAALKAVGRVQEALAMNERAAVLYPDSVVAHHNLAATLGDLARFAGAERSAARALKAPGGGAAQSWLVYARALQGQNRLEEAEAAFREAIRREPGYVEAHRDLAQLVWMRTEDAGAAVAAVDAAIPGAAQGFALWEIKATILEYAGQADAAYGAIREGIGRHPKALGLHLAAAHLAARAGDTQAALRHAETAVSLVPGSRGAQDALCVACVAMGDAARAGAIADRLVAERPFDQRALALQAVAWRLLGDERYAALYDYDGLVRAWTLDVPEGWGSLAAYLADLEAALAEVHPFRTHPLDQSLRHGSQAPHLLASANPVIRAFFQAVDGPIRRHLAAIGPGEGPFRSRNSGGYEFQGVWSVRLRPGGFHTDHVHPQGWVSSACYIAFPPDRPASGREGWIKFGEPGIATRPALEAEHFIKPEPGMLVLFPSYMWHGTVPFGGELPRLTVAFDVRPMA